VAKKVRSKKTSSGPIGQGSPMPVRSGGAGESPESLGLWPSGQIPTGPPRKNVDTFAGELARAVNNAWKRITGT
jgi:hypothetical protein